MAKKHTVLIMRCDDYDPDKISGIVKAGMELLGVQPSGNILLKPNVVMAHPEIFPHAFTRGEFLDGVISAVKARSCNAKKISVGERSGITIPTRWNFKNAGYNAVLKKHHVKACYFDETKQVPVRLHHKDRLRDAVFVPKPVRDTDFLINLPKFKAHPWCRLTASLKNYIGIQDDRHRLVDHNTFLEHKIADLQEVVESKFIAVDAIEAGQRMMLTPTPFQMGAIVMGTNSCAVDTVCCHMVHVDPTDVIHLKYVSERGYGPADIDDIEITGDYPLDELKEKTKKFEFCMSRVDDYFGKDSHISCTVGTFPEQHSTDYCWGGCPGALQEAVHIYKAYNPGVEKNIQKIRYVVGAVTGPLDIAKDERVLFAGDCTSWQGDIDGKRVELNKSYRSVHDVDERKTRSNDMLLRTIKTLWNCFRNRGARYMHAKGCPVSVGDHVHYLAFLGNIQNINFVPSLLISINTAYWIMRVNRLINRLMDR